MNHTLTVPDPETNVFWLHGAAGSGKDRLLQPASHALDLLEMLDPVLMDATLRPLCLNGTRTAVLQNVIRTLTMPVFWLHGAAGSGKITISIT
ncbi:hypothetical protein FIBSPDRAFT_515352 [Athelia psychrophila]|uniref:Uncharacterized protein n=1 Tax=Athelia psychrophila TaxID=1759441 RepID=A0A166V3K9_9AGAM|nr:hypothetical protein FIBSPDRAFT_515352 [Fibularhizoctonia sp. CBS 109695]